MKYLLDTNTWIDIVRWQNPVAIAKLKSHIPRDIYLCSVVLAEMWFGVSKSRSQYKLSNLADISNLRQSYSSLPFDDDAAQHYADIRADLERKGTPIGPNDLLIAAIARVHNATLVTKNLSEFARVDGLTVESWC